MKAFIKKIYCYIDTISKDISNRKLGVYAASSAFFVFLSLVPIIIILCCFIQYTPITQETLIGYFDNIFPSSMQTLVNTIVNDVYSASLATLSISIFATLWSSSKAFVAISKGLNEMYSVERGRNYFVQRLYGVCLMLFILGAMFVTMIIGSFGAAIGKLLNFDKNLYSFLVSFRYIFIFILLSILFAVLYRFGPNKKLSVIRQLPGAMLAALSWLLFSLLFSLYVTFSRGSVIYGSLATIIFAMLWIYYCMYIFLFGAYVNVRYFKADRLPVKKSRRKTT